MINVCIFPVAGYGTRFLPITKAIPKEMLPVLSKPLIQYSFVEAIESDIRNLTLIISDSKKPSFDLYFEANNKLEDLLSAKRNNSLDELNMIIDSCKVNFVNQSEMLGLGHAILQSKEIVGESEFAVILPDDLCFNKEKSVLSQMKRIHEIYPDKCIVAVEEIKSSDSHKYGIIEGEVLEGKIPNIFSVRKMIEKPSEKEAPSNLAIIGRYILLPEIFDVLEQTNADKNGEIQITDALNILASRNKVLAYKFQGIRLDCGSVEGFVEANNFFFEMSKN